MRVLVGGNDVTQYVQPGSLSWTDDMNARNTARFLIRDTDGSVSVDIGDEVLILDDDSVVLGGSVRYFPMVSLSSGGGGIATVSTRLFAGTVEDAEENLLFGNEPVWTTGAGDVRDITITSVDFNQLADRFLVAESYDGTTIDGIATDLIANYLGNDGVVIGFIDAGPVITRKVFSYVTLTEALNWCAEQTGYVWDISYTRVFSLRAPSSVAAPFTADGSTTISMRSRRPRGQYRNRQYIRAGRDLTDPRTESFVGDGTRRTFNVAFPIGEEPSATVNVVSKTIGIRGVEIGFDWYWNKENAEFSQDESGTVLTSADTLAVTYRGLFPILVQAQDDAKILERAEAEGGSGVYEAIEEHPELDDSDMTLDTALAKLQREGVIHQYVDLVTDEDGLRAGQLLTIYEPSLGLDGSFLIQSVTAQDVSGSFLRYTATALSGDAVGGWLAFYQKLMAQQRRSGAERENEVLLLLRMMADQVVMSDSLATPTQAAPETRIGFAIIGQSEIG